MKPTYQGPCSHLIAHDATRGKRLGSSVIWSSAGLPIEYCAALCSPPRIVGEVRSMALARRRLKLDAELVPKPALSFTLDGVTMLPSLIVPQLAPLTPTKELRLAKLGLTMSAPVAFPLPVVVPSSMLTVCS